MLVSSAGIHGTDNQRQPRAEEPAVNAYLDVYKRQIEYNPPQFTESVLRDIMESIPISVNASEIITFLMNGQVAFVQACGNKY